jgi:hypothetical protein
LKKFFIFFTLIFFLVFRITAQEVDNLLDMDFDLLFDESYAGQDDTGSITAADTSPVNVNQRGITFGASFEFQGGLAPGWTLTPWHFDGTEEYSWGQSVKMVSSMSINAQLSDVFKVYTSLGYSIPGFYFALGDFFFDYNFYNTVFLRAGKYEHTWGYSGFTNLLARVPDMGPSGPSYIIKIDIPVGVGGFQALALTRVDIAGGNYPAEWSDLGFGGKYNIALRWADFDLGVFHQREAMPTRGFFSIKTTLGKTELYNEWLLAVNTHTDNAVSFAANLGLGRDFFGDKLTLGGEVFYNGEGNTYFFKPETSFTDAETAQFLSNFNIGLNFIYRFDIKGSPKFFTSASFSTAEKAVLLTPGFRLTPFSNIDVYLAVPMVLGDKDCFYYSNNNDPNNRPFNVVMLVTLSGSVFASSF